MNISPIFKPPNPKLPLTTAVTKCECDACLEALYDVCECHGFCQALWVVDKTRKSTILIPSPINIYLCVSFCWRWVNKAVIVVKVKLSCRPEKPKQWVQIHCNWAEEKAKLEDNVDSYTLLHTSCHVIHCQYNNIDNRWFHYINWTKAPKLTFYCIVSTNVQVSFWC